jgi:hypothetical protein
MNNPPTHGELQIPELLLSQERAHDWPAFRQSTVATNRALPPARLRYPAREWSAQGRERAHNNGPQKSPLLKCARKGYRSSYRATVIFDVRGIKPASLTCIANCAFPFSLPSNRKSKIAN